MNEYNPIDLLFAGMGKLGPGSDADTLHVLRLLPKREYSLIVDAGCGTGRQTLALAKELRTRVHAVDSYEKFLQDLSRRAAACGLAHLIEAHCMDMKDIPGKFSGIDLLWSEGAAYNIGFAHALDLWAPAINQGGYAVISELCWLRSKIPTAAQEFFAEFYPEMQPVEQNRAIAEKAGYGVREIHTLPREAWTEGYYDVLGPRAQALVRHGDSSVRELAAEMMREIDVFDHSEESYGYVLYVLENIRGNRPRA